MILLAFSCKRRHFCPSCHKKRVVEFGEWLCEEILKHLDLWDKKARPPPKANPPRITSEYHIDYTDSQLPASDKWLYVDPVYLSDRLNGFL